MTAAPRVALAILRAGDGYGLQLRDDRPDVASPGCWALFGGGIACGESPVAAMRREIREELGLDVELWEALWVVHCYVPLCDAVVPHAIFAADVSDVWSTRVLSEGQAADCFAIDALPEPMEDFVRALLERYHTTVSFRA